MTIIRRHLGSPAMIVACVSLVVALGGVSYAAGVLPQNSVGTAQLKKKAVTGAKLKNNAVTGAKVKNRTLMAADFKAGQLTEGPQGPKGDPGLPGQKGEPGRSALSSLQPGETVRGVIVVDDHATGAGENFAASATLPIPASTPLSASTVDIDGIEEVGNRCTGTLDQPTAPAGVACIYAPGPVNTATTHASALSRFGIFVRLASAAAGDIDLYGTWAYTEPN